MNPLADPFSKVHPLFWPVLWLSLRAFVAWTGKLIEAGHGYASMRVEITWYGWIEGPQAQPQHRPEERVHL